MTTYSIATDNNITAHATAAEAQSIPESDHFASAKELGQLAGNWPAARLVGIWNSLPGQKPVKKFKDRRAAVSRIWAALQNLAPDAGPPAAPVATRKPKSGKRTTEPAKPAPARHGSKAAQIIDLLQRPGGATLQDLMHATAWQAHSIRGFVSGTLGKKMGLTVVSTKRDDGERVYSITR